jgi:2-iminobutanoate/2-iminopropanoate deaminase
MTDYINDAPNAPKAIGPYSQATAVGNLVFLSGQIPLDPSSGQIVEGGIEKQTEQVLKNLGAVLAHAKLTFSNVLKTTIFLTDLAHFQVVNGIYEKALGTSKPARATVQVAALPRGAMVEIEMIAARVM